MFGSAYFGKTYFAGVYFPPVASTGRRRKGLINRGMVKIRQI